MKSQFPLEQEKFSLISFTTWKQEHMTKTGVQLFLYTFCNKWWIKSYVSKFTKLCPYRYAYTFIEATRLCVYIHSMDIYTQKPKAKKPFFYKIDCKLTWAGKGSRFTSPTDEMVFLRATSPLTLFPVRRRRHRFWWFISSTPLYFIFRRYVLVYLVSRLNTFFLAT